MTFRELGVKYLTKCFLDAVSCGIDVAFCLVFFYEQGSMVFKYAKY